MKTYKWETMFDKTWRNVNGITVMDKPLKDFIRSLLDSQRTAFLRLIEEFIDDLSEAVKKEGEA